LLWLNDRPISYTKSVWRNEWEVRPLLGTRPYFKFNPYSGRERHNALHYRQTDRQTVCTN